MAGATAVNVATFTPGGGYGVAVNIPDSTASSGSGTVFIQLSCPSGLEWCAFGQGNQMSGANIMVMYAASSSNVTVSPRLGKGHFEPSFNSDAQVTLLQGSGIRSDGSMVANVRCDSCTTWSGGSMDVTSSSSNWIMAYKAGSSLDSTDQSANIDQHDTHDQFTLDLTTGTGGSSSNPFISSSDGNSNSNTASGSPTATDSSPTATGTSDPSQTDTNSSPTESDGVSSPLATSGSSSRPSNAPSSAGRIPVIVDPTRAGHGVLMCICFVLLFPLSALTIYLPFAQKVRFIHAPLQMISAILMIVGLALGVILGKRLDELDRYHQIVGYIVVGCLILFQPALGIAQHLYFHRTGGRSVMGIIHRWLGRCAIILGIVNGGLGFMMAGPVGKSPYVPNYAVIAYSVVAVIVFIIYVVVLVMSNIRAKKRSPDGEKYYRNNGFEMHPSSTSSPRANAE